ncbi:MAG: hypothetical protein ACFFD2_17130 [Promethearchaeota archaeon]
MGGIVTLPLPVLIEQFLAVLQLIFRVIGDLLGDVPPLEEIGEVGGRQVGGVPRVDLHAHFIQQQPIHATFIRINGKERVDGAFRYFADERDADLDRTIGIQVQGHFTIGIRLQPVIVV